MNKRNMIVISLGSILLASSALGQTAQQQREAAEVAERKKRLADMFTNPVNGGAFLDPARPTSGSSTPVGAPVPAFKGCTAPKNLDDLGADNAERMRTRQAGLTDPVSARRFAAIDIGSAGENSESDFSSDCRFRLDGVWKQDVPIAFDTNKAAGVFSAVPGGQLNTKLTHGNYSTPILMYVDMTGDGQQLSIRPATQGHAPIKLGSRDRVSLKELFTPNGPRKSYWTFASPSTELEVATDRFGRVSLRWGGKKFVRPKPTVSESQNTSSIDVFAVGFNLDNLAANRRGYDIVTQDVFELNDNAKSEVFAPADPKDYAIVEKRTVPLGLKLIPEGQQGTITASQLISNQRDYQKTVNASLGVNIGFKALAPDGQSREDLGSASAGVNYARENTSGMSRGSKQSTTVGYARHKLYALVLDQPFAKLSQDFIVALDEAARFNRYDDVIAKFGTHYPYAVTYGSAARMEAYFSQETVARWQTNGENVSTNGGFSILGFGVSTQSNVYTQTNESNRQLQEASGKRFDAVGGTGSFGEGGHSTGTPYPILADLRPLYELLNPLNFPNEPKMYGDIRGRLKQATEKYLRKNSGGLSSVSTLPDLQEWEFRSRFLRCNLFDGEKFQKLNITGGISLHTTPTRGLPDYPTLWPFKAQQANVFCTGRQGQSYSNFGNQGRFVVKGTAAQIASYKFHYVAQLYYTLHAPYQPGRRTHPKATSEHISFPVSTSDPVGKNYGRIWSIPTGNYQPSFDIYTTFRRIR